jgi:hypothetical protein
MAALPTIGSSGEPVGDLTTGSSGGHTDIVSVNNSTEHSCYVIMRTLNNIQYLIIRFRIGGASTASKGYSFLMDTDEKFGNVAPNNDPDYTTTNPGFDKEVVLETGTNGRVAVYNLGANSTATLVTSFSINEYHQRSVALTTISSNPDYFYDFFIPYSALGLTTEPVRIAAVTVTSAGSGITGTISDFNGVNDLLYANNSTTISTALVNAFPATPLTSITGSFTYPPSKTLTPTVNSGITTSSSSISGTSAEANGTTIYVYKNGVQIGTTTVSGGTWSLTGVSGLAVGNNITAKALATGKTLSDESNTVVVTGLQTCYLVAPVCNTTLVNGQTKVTGTWSGSSPVPANTIKIRCYTVSNNSSNPPTYTEIFQASNAICYVNTDGTWEFNTQYNQSQFTGYTFYVKAESSTCLSDYSNGVNPQPNGAVITTPPQVLTSPIYASVSNINIQVQNLFTTNAAFLTLYVNGVSVSTTATAINSNATHTFSVGNLFVGDIIYARAKGNLSTQYLSNISNTVTVIESVVQSDAPVITGTYFNGNTTVTGTSTEPAGTIIYVYVGSTLVGTGTVTMYGTWSVTVSPALATGNVITAKAKASGETLSNASNAVTVAASAPAAPVITGSYVVGNTSVSGTGANTRLILYVDGTPVDSSNITGNWTISNLTSNHIYRGAVLTARNKVSNILSAESNAVTVTGVASFLVLDSLGNALTQVYSGQKFKVRFKAKDGNNGGGNDFTAFADNVTVSSSANMLFGEGTSENFSSGVLGNNYTTTPKYLSLGGSGNGKRITIVNPNDPSAFGEATVDIIPAEWKGRTTQADDNDNKRHNHAENWTHKFVPLNGADVRFASNAVRDCELKNSIEYNDLDFNSSDKKMVLGNYNLTLKSVTNHGSVHRFKTNGTGKLRMNFPVNTATTLHVGNSAYNPVTITNQNATADTFAVRVLDEMYQGGLSGFVTINGKVQRTWDITKSTANTGSGVDITLTWNNGEIVNGGIFGDFVLYHHNGTAWEKHTTGLTKTATSLTKTGYTGTFSPFGAGEDEALPVTLIDFVVSCEETYPVFEWSTASEINNYYFSIDQSADMAQWQSVAQITGAGNSNVTTTYRHVLHTFNAANGRYFRLRQVDYNGTEEVVSQKYLSACEGAAEGFAVFPNPTHDIIQVQQLDVNTEVQLMNALGETLQSTKTGTSGQVTFTLSSAAGVYYIRGMQQGVVVVQKVMKI